MRTRAWCAPMIPLLLAASLCGCGEAADDNALALELRSEFLAMESLEGSMEVTADYGQRVYTYGVDFTASKTDGMTLTLTRPEEVAGITAHIAQGETALVFDGLHLATSPLNGEGLSPLDVLPALITAMQTGYMAETCSEQLGETAVLRITCRDPNREPGEGTETVLWFDKAQKTLLRCQLRSGGRTVVRCRFSAFVIGLPAPR